MTISIPEAVEQYVCTLRHYLDNKDSMPLPLHILEHELQPDCFLVDEVRRGDLLLHKRKREFYDVLKKLLEDNTQAERSKSTGEKIRDVEEHIGDVDADGYRQRLLIVSIKALHAPKPNEARVVVGCDSFTVFEQREKEGEGLTGEDEPEEEGRGAKVWLFHIPYERGYTPDEKKLLAGPNERAVNRHASPPNTEDSRPVPRSVLRLVQLAQYGHCAGKKQLPVTVVLPPKPADSTIVPACGPLAELYGYYADKWSWLRESPAKKQRLDDDFSVLQEDRPSAAVIAKHAKRGGVVVWVATRRIVEALAEIGGSGLWVNTGPDGVERALDECSALGNCADTAGCKNDLELWRATPRSVDDSVITGQLAPGDIALTASGYGEQYLLRDSGGRFRGFWLREDGLCRYGDPGMLELGLEALVTLAGHIGHDGQARSDVLVHQGPVFPENVPDDKRVIFVATGDAKPPRRATSLWSALRRSKQPDIFVDGNGDGRHLVLTGKDREAFAKVAWVHLLPADQPAAGQNESRKRKALAVLRNPPSRAHLVTALALLAAITGGVGFHRRSAATGSAVATAPPLAGPPHNVSAPTENAARDLESRLDTLPKEQLSEAERERLANEAAEALQKEYARLNEAAAAAYRAAEELSQAHERARLAAAEATAEAAEAEAAAMERWPLSADEMERRKTRAQDARTAAASVNESMKMLADEVEKAKAKYDDLDAASTQAWAVAKEAMCAPGTTCAKQQAENEIKAAAERVARQAREKEAEDKKARDAEEERGRTAEALRKYKEQLDAASKEGTEHDPATDVRVVG